ncbi:hypothetical protein JW960_06560 [candidate division KSB1 bacterium]|nr:hypothetical protein [candidate division KSB1 bacterium]
MIAGITVQQQINNSSWLSDTLISQMKLLQVTHGLSCLIDDVDLLFADLCYQRHIPYSVIVSSNDFETSFAEPDQIKLYHTLVDHALYLYRLGFSHPSRAAIWAAQQYMVDHCALLFSVWDGKTSLGTEVVESVMEYALHHKKKIVQINPETREILPINS